MIEKHQAEIINYNRRSRASKTIGSGRVETAIMVPRSGCLTPKNIQLGVFPPRR